MKTFDADEHAGRGLLSRDAPSLHDVATQKTTTWR